MTETALPDVQIMSWGLAYTSVCVLADTPIEVIERETNAQLPTGISSRWTISDDPKFADGSPNPCPCNENPGRLHYLLSCW